MNHHASVMLRICDACGAQHQLAARRLIVALTLATALLTPSHAFGSVDGRLSFPHAATSAFTWFEPIEMHWSGLPVSARSFVAALPLEQAARLMARHEKRFQRITTLPGAILLSGVDVGLHWVAQLEVRHGLVRGMVSALPLDAASGPKAAGQGFLASWLAQNARFVFSQASSADGRPMLQSVYIPHRSFDVFVEALDRRLAESRWQRTGEHSWTARSAGVRPAGPRIDVFPVPAALGGADAVLVNLSE